MLPVGRAKWLKLILKNVLVNIFILEPIIYSLPPFLKELVP